MAQKKRNEVYRMFLDKKKGELEIVLKNGQSITLSVKEQKIEAELFFR